MERQILMETFIKRSSQVMAQDKNLTEDYINKSVRISPVKIFKFLLQSIAFLLVAHIVSLLFQSYYPHHERISGLLDKFFNFNNESNFPTFFSAIQLLTATCLLFYISTLTDVVNKAKNKKFWFALGCVFLFLTLDEATEIHEELNSLFRRVASDDLSGYLTWAWVIPYTVFILGIALYFLNFVLSLPAKTRNLFFLAGFIFVGGALGIEYLEGYYFKLYGLEHYSSRILYTVQEICEMTGIAIFVYALLDYLVPLRVNVLFSKKENANPIHLN